MARRRNRRELAARVREVVLALPEWTMDIIGDRPHVHTSLANLEIVLTRDGRVYGMPASNGIDIWIRGGRKVFSAWWDDLNLGREHEIEVIACATGDWDAPFCG